jgi:hypothetical protein
LDLRADFHGALDLDKHLLMPENQTVPRSGLFSCKACRLEEKVANSDEEYLNIIVNAIQVCSHYKPKLGRGEGRGYSLEEFQGLYQADSFYNWFGLDNSLMYAAHKAAGGMTSIYRQIGIGGEHLFRKILQDQLNLSETDSTWSYEIPVLGRSRKRKLSLDGRIPLDMIQDIDVRNRIWEWIRDMTTFLDVDHHVSNALSGAVFEIRQGYKSKDSKRQNADLANASTAYTKTYFPCIVVLSSQIDADIMYRYQAAKWGILVGIMGADDPTKSTYDFMKSIIGYDLAGFFKRNSEKLTLEVENVLNALLLKG